ncbi:amine oxidase catalytic domain-containing protein [Armillaria gallica]|uniref:Amine oxidase n=1 Tax=Armillaria gallica TaxID=47427 RepID=A0A2H3DSX1_ARMGA|nr:amine oxidase catalytic domain-containing protein [Armillaria gallica]
MPDQHYERLKDPETDLIKPSKRRWGFGLVSVVVIAILSLISLHNTNLWRFFDESELPSSYIESSEPTTLERCTSSLPPPVDPPAPVNVWASLTVAETTDIQRWLEQTERGLNLTRASVSTFSDNVIFMIELYYPPKSAALEYLASPDAISPPGKFARVTIHHGVEPVIKDYLVGPLPIGPETTMKPLANIYHREDIPFHAGGYATGSELSLVVSKIAPDFGEALFELFGGVARGYENDTLIVGASAPFSFDGSFRRVWLNWKLNTPGPWLHPLNFFQYVDISGTDPSLWKVLKVVYNHQVFNSTESFMGAFRNGTLVRLPERPENKDPSWTTRKRVGKQRDLDHLPGPRSVSFAGLRFRVDKARQYITWMGWSMYLGFDRDMGLSLWNIGFKGERIIYQACGNDPMQATTAWLDRYFGMGGSVRDMLPGYDCPHEAVYLPMTSYASTGSVVRKRAVCIFEQDTGRPITRHAGYMQGEFGAVKGYILTVRSISTFDYMFQLDGSIEVRVSASGYLQGGYWDPKQNGYGGRIRETTMGNLHDHVINFKIDLDIGGIENSLLETTTNQEVVIQPWFDDDWGQEVIQQKITKKIIENENDALLKYPQNFQGGYSIINQDNRNAWGLPRGYAIHQGYSPIHNTVVGSKRLLNNANWARYNLAVSHRKETEPSSSAIWNMNLPGKPAVDFHNFFDGENITQTDLVAWVNVGMHHLPVSEDSPNTKTNLAASSFLLTPWNYFDSDPSMESSNAILLKIPEKRGESFGYDNYGVKQEYTCIPEVPSPFEYSFVDVFDADGQLQAPSLEELRKNAERHHRIKVEL